MSWILPEKLEMAVPFATSLGIGLLVGFERERNPAAKAGLRTFALASLFGTLCALLGEKLGSAWLIPAGLIAMTAFIYGAYRDDAEEADPGTTTQVALVVVYALGVLVWLGQATLAGMLGITVTALLHFKPELHGFTERLSRQDLVSILQFCTLSFVILPILPNTSFGPYNAFNPHQIWWMVVLISGVSLAGYIALKWVGERYGVALLGVFGGMASSTATTLVYARQSRQNPAAIQAAGVVVMLANLVVLIRLLVLVATLRWQVLPLVLPPLLGGLLLGGAYVWHVWRELGATEAGPRPVVTNPTELRTAFSFAGLYAFVLLGAAWLNDLAGAGGLYLIALVSGLSDVDAITLSTLHLAEIGRVSDVQAACAVVIAVLANLAFKVGLIWGIGGSLLLRRTTRGFLAMFCGIAGGASIALVYG